MSYLLIQADARRIPLADHSVDCIVTDPPYGQTNEAYDSDIAFHANVWRECFRVAKPNTAMICFAGSPTYHRIASAIEAGGWRVRQMWGWIYRNGLITSAWPKEGFDRLAPAMDPIVYATKGKILLNLNREGEPWKAWRKKKPTDVPYSERSSVMTGVLEAEGHWPRTIVSDGESPFQYFVLPRSSGKHRQERTGHPNQKPTDLIHWILRKLPGDLILDPFQGSGTAGVVALALKRNYIGLDLSGDYLGQTRRRIERPHQPMTKQREHAMPLFAHMEDA